MTGRCGVVVAHGRLADGLISALRFTIVYARKKGVWLMEAWHSARRAS